MSYSNWVIQTEMAIHDYSHTHCGEGVREGGREGSRERVEGVMQRVVKNIWLKLHHKRLRTGLLGVILSGSKEGSIYTLTINKYRLGRNE